MGHGGNNEQIKILIKNKKKILLKLKNYNKNMWQCNLMGKKDLKWLSNTYGVNMSMTWPQFEVYTNAVKEM